MSRQKPDAAEYRPSMGPLFEDPARLTRRDGPATSRIAAGEVIASGSAQVDLDMLVELVGRFPGRTLARYGEIAAVEQAHREVAASDYWWRLKLGRRTGDAVDAGLIHAKGREDGMQRWWPGRDPERERP